MAKFNEKQMLIQEIEADLLSDDQLQKLGSVRLELDKLEKCESELNDLICGSGLATVLRIVSVTPLQQTRNDIAVLVTNHIRAEKQLQLARVALMAA